MMNKGEIKKKHLNNSETLSDFSLQKRKRQSGLRENVPAPIPQIECKQFAVILKKGQINLLSQIWILQKNNTVALRSHFPHLTDRQFYYAVGNLCTFGLIESLTKNSLTLHLTFKGEQYLSAYCGLSQNRDEYVNIIDRAHKITIVQSVLKRGCVPDGFSASDGCKLRWKEPQLIRRDGSQHLCIRVTPKSIVYHFSERYGVDAQHIVSCCLDVVWRYSRSFLASGWVLDFPSAAIVDQHHALSHGELSRFSRRFQVFYKSKRLSFDSSVSSGEFELIGSSSDDDFLLLVEFFEAILRENVRLQDLSELIAMLPHLKALLQKSRYDVSSVVPELMMNDGKLKRVDKT